MAGQKSGYVVVDGSSVAEAEKTGTGQPKLANIERMVQALVDEKGYSRKKIIVFVDASLRHKIDDAAKLETMIAKRVVHQVPSGTQADEFILKYADELNATVVSNDDFRDYLHVFPWVAEKGRLLKFMIVNGIVKFRDTPLFPKLSDQGVPVKVFPPTLSGDASRAVASAAAEMIPGLSPGGVRLVYTPVWHFRFNVAAAFRYRGEVVDEINLSGQSIFIDQLSGKETTSFAHSSVESDEPAFPDNIDWEIVQPSPLPEMKEYAKQLICRKLRRRVECVREYYAPGGVLKHATEEKVWQPYPREVAITSAELLYVPFYVLEGKIGSNKLELRFHAADKKPVLQEVPKELKQCPGCSRYYLTREFSACFLCGRDYCSRCSESWLRCISCGKQACQECATNKRYSLPMHKCHKCNSTVCKDCMIVKGLLFRKVYCKNCC